MANVLTPCFSAPGTFRTKNWLLYSRQAWLGERKYHAKVNTICYGGRSGVLSIHASSRSVKIDDVVLEANKMLMKNDYRCSPCWFTPDDCGQPPPKAPLLLYLPGIDGTGFGMGLQHQALGELFEVQCLQIPAMDRTSFEGLLSLVEIKLNEEQRKTPSRPIYLVGECSGGCLGLAVSARNPDIDITLILVNPGTCFSKSHLWTWFSLREALPDEIYSALPFRQEKSWALTKLLPRESLLWRIRVLQSAESFANSVLPFIKHSVLLLASGKDEFLPSRDEACRLKERLKSCKVRYFKDAGHYLLLEEDISLSTIIKSVGSYRISRSHDYVHDYVWPTREEIEKSYENYGILRKLTSPVMFSTNQSGEIMKGLAGIPDEGPVLYVGIHMLLGLDIRIIFFEFLKKRNILLRGMAHPFMFDDAIDEDLQEPSFYDEVRLFGAVPATGKNLLKLLSSKSHVLLYPGGAREALHRKGEQYKLFWPEQAEFVRTAARCKATIVPFGIVGEDDIAEVILGYEEVSKIPYYKDMLERFNNRVKNIRSSFSGEVANQQMYLPLMLPKPPGRLYVLFGKPVSTAGRMQELKDKSSAQAMYLEVKKEVENTMAYLLEKRKEDPYRRFLPRFAYEALSGFTIQMPTFEQL